MEKINVAEVLKPQGIKGEIKFRLLSTDSENLLNVSFLELGGKEVSINTIRETNGFLYIKFNEINSVLEAESFRGKFLMASKQELHETLKEGEYFIEDLIGKQIVFENGDVLGKLTDVQNFGSADVMYVLKPNGKEVLFSNVEDVIIKVTDDNIVINKKRFEEVSV